MATHEDTGSDSEFEEEERPGLKAKKRRRGSKIMQTQKRSKQDNEIPVTLFEVVRQGKMAMTAIVDDWIEAYKSDRNEALLDLIQFFIHAAGCKGTLTLEMLRDASEGFQDVIKRMTEEFDEDSGDYPLIASGLNYKKFRSNFSDFVQALVRQCQYQIIYDQFMMDNILTLLTELSNSQVRAFRHTSTLAAMKLMTALVNVALQLSVSLDNTQRQYESERSKNASKRASEKLDILLQKRKELEDQQTEIESMLNGIFKGIFVHRYRDYIADIRALCMEEIGVWMKMFPKVFLTDSYLKYVGWTLHDKQKEVRLKCLQTLQGLYRDDEMTKDLKLFTSRFKDRIVSMTLDKEYDVAVLAIKLLILILDHCGYDAPVVSSGDSESVYQLVYSVHRPVAIAAAEYLNKQLFLNKEVVPGYTKRGRRRSPNAPLITDLVLFFIESELHEHATYLVDSLWDVASGMLKDWDCMTDLLLEEPANDRDQMDSRQESVLVDIMVCAVKQAAEGTPPTGRQGYSKKMAVRDRRAVIEDRVRLTEHFIITLPSLLNKYQVDKEKVTSLLQIPRFFDLDLYTTSRLEKHLEMLLRQMAVIVEKHTDSDVLEQASMTYHVLCDNDYTMCDKAQVERQTVVDSWVESYNLALDIFKEAANDADEEEIYNVVQSLKRLTHIYMHNNIASCELYPNVSAILHLHQEKPDMVHEDMLDQAVQFIHCDLPSNLVLVKNRETSGHGDSPEQKQAVATLRHKVTEFMHVCQELLAQSPHAKVKEASYMAICDLVVMFAPQLAHTSPSLRPLVQRPSDTLQHLLVEFVNTYVFILPDEDEEDDEDTAKIDALHHRRLLLAALCKLFVFNMVDLRLAASTFQQYIRFYSDYGDIIKETISKSRHLNKMKCANTLALSLMTLYRDTVRIQGGQLDHSSQEYAHMKELARRFSLTFGLDQVKTRDAVAILHKEGILFALKRSDENQNESIPPENLSFLSILVEFSSKLMKQDRKTVVNYLDKHIKPHMLTNQSAGWIPLVTYRNSLVQGADDIDTGKVGVKGRRGRKKRQVEGDMEAPQTPMTPATPMSPAPMTPINPAAQQLTSTALRDGTPSKHMRMAEDHNLSTISYQQKKTYLGSWLSSEREQGRKKRGRKQKKKQNAKVTSDSDDSIFKKPLPKPRSMLASIFDSDFDSQTSEESKDERVRKSEKVSEIGKRMKRIDIKENKEPKRVASSRGRLRSVPSYSEDIEEEIDEEDFQVEEKKNKKDSTGDSRKQIISQDSIAEDEIFDFSDEEQKNEEESSQEESNHPGLRSPDRKKAKLIKKSRNAKSRDVTDIDEDSPNYENPKRKMDVGPVTERSPTTSDTPGSQIEKFQFEMSEKSTSVKVIQEESSPASNIPKLDKTVEDGFFSANENSAEEDEFEDAPSENPSEIPSDEDAASNPFLKIIRRSHEQARRVITPERVARMVEKIDSDESSGDVSSDEEEEEEEVLENPVSQATHISDVNLMENIMDEDDLEKQEEMFGAFLGVVKNAHDQSSQQNHSQSSFNLSTRRNTGPKNSSADFDVDDLFASDQDGSETSWSGTAENPFAEALRKARAYPTSPTSPMSSEDDDNFAAMFGFAIEKKSQKSKSKRQQNLIGSSISLPSPHPSMTSPVHQGTPDYHHQMRHGFQMPSTPLQGNMQQQMASLSPQQQFVVPGQSMMYQSTSSGFQMPMQSPGHMQQPGMPGQSPFYGN